MERSDSLEPASEFLELILGSQKRSDCPIVKKIKISDIQVIAKYLLSTLPPSVPSPVSEPWHGGAHRPVGIHRETCN